MYNQKRKEEYLMNEANRRNIEPIFNATKPFEQKLNKDLCDMTPNELLEILDKYQNKHTAYTVCSRISSYNEWCVDMGFCHVNHASSKRLPRNMIHAISNNKNNREYVPHDKFISYCTQIQKKSLNTEYDLALFMTVYNGIKTPDIIMQLSYDMIDRSKKIICYDDNHSITITDELIDAYDKCKSINVYIYKEKYRLQDVDLTHSFVQNAIFKTNFNTIPSASRQIRTRLASIKDMLDEDISYDNLMLSGMFYYIVSDAQNMGYDIIGDSINCKHNKEMTIKYYDILSKKGIIDFFYFKTKFAAYIKNINGFCI